MKSHKLARERRYFSVIDTQCKRWSYPAQAIVFGPTTELAAKKECARLNAPNEKAEASGDENLDVSKGK